MKDVNFIDVEESPLNAKQAAALFGIKADAMYKRAKNGLAPHHKMGRKIYFLIQLLQHLQNTSQSHINRAILCSTFLKEKPSYQRKS